MKGPFFLPADVSEGDYIEFGLTGAYGAALATKFNGFGDYLETVVHDAPMTSMYGLAARKANVVAMTKAAK
jgi:ornithine decarboxylase